MILTGNIFAEFNAPPIELGFPADAVSFSLIDSIHSLYSRATLQYDDRNGNMSEYLVTTPGSVLQISYGIDGDLETREVGGKYVITQETINEGDSQPTNSYGGLVNLSFQHEWMNFQTIDSVSHQGPLHSVLNRLVSEYPFEAIQIDQVENNDIWYQALRTKGKMIVDDFVPEAYSQASNKTPFFAFIDSKNRFRFHSYAQMFGGAVTQDNSYTVTKSDVSGNNKIVMAISHWSQTLAESKKTKRHSFYNVGEDFSVTKTELKTENFFPIGSQEVYTQSNDRGSVLDYSVEYFGDTTESEREGTKSGLMRESLFKDRFMVLIPFNPDLIAGSTISVEFQLPNAVNDTFSERFSGKYIVEMTEHTWDGPSASAISKLIISRKYAEVPNEYKLRFLMA